MTWKILVIGNDTFKAVVPIGSSGTIAEAAARSDIAKDALQKQTIEQLTIIAIFREDAPYEFEHFPAIQPG